jgi:hypothetical protein
MNRENRKSWHIRRNAVELLAYLSGMKLVEVLNQHPLDKFQVARHENGCRSFKVPVKQENIELENATSS